MENARSRTKLDRNHRQIVRALRAIGATTHSLATVGSGCPDLVVGISRLNKQTGRMESFNYLLEIKNPLNPKAGLTPCQIKWIESWQGQVAVVVTPEQAMLAIGCTPEEIQAYEMATIACKRLSESTEKRRSKIPKRKQG